MTLSPSNLDRDQLQQALDVLGGLLVEGEDQPFTPPVPYAFDFADAPPDLAARMVESLRLNGLVVVRNFMPTVQVDRLAAAFRAFMADIADDLAAPETGERETYFLQDQAAPRYTNYLELTQAPKPVVHVRAFRDRGMIDVFNVDRLFPDLADDLTPVRGGLLTRVYGLANGGDYRVPNTNIYYTRDIPHTRGFHADNFDRPQAKAFIYLTDVVDERDGPHYYGLGTHNAPRLQDLNRLINQKLDNFPSDYFVFHKSRVRCLTAPRGTLIMSYQNGAHRGGVQAPGHERMVLVQNFFAEK